VLRRDAPLGGSLEVLEETYVRRIWRLWRNLYIGILEVLEETLWLLLHKEYRRWIEMPT
jgi:hypothetical protein